MHHYIGFTAEGPSVGVEELIAAGVLDTMQARYNLMFRHPSDWHNNTGVICQAKEQEMGIILMRPLTSGVFQRLMAGAFPETDPDYRVGAGGGPAAAQLLLSDPYVDVALVGMREPRFVELNNEISDDVASWIDLAKLHNGYVS